MLTRDSLDLPTYDSISKKFSTEEIDYLFRVWQKLSPYELETEIDEFFKILRAEKRRRLTKDPEEFVKSLTPDQKDFIRYWYASDGYIQKVDEEVIGRICKGDE